MKLPRLLRERKAAADFNAQDRSWRRLVFYSEGSADWPHLGPVIHQVLAEHDLKISYLTSDPADPGLSIADDRLRSFQVGTGTIRTILFAKMECDHFVMTLPDLGELWLKRSVHPVHYIYMFHSTNSTHTVYRKGAFDNYDTILCVGPHHVEELRRTETEYGLRPKELVEHGSVKLDSVMAAVSSDRRAGSGPGDVLVAPSWGEGSIIESPVGTEVIDNLLRDGLRVTLRLHPMTVRRFPDLVPALRSRYRDAVLFSLEEDMNIWESWARSAVMVSDWSGAATEYAFALERPVAFVNMPQKIRNPEWRRIGLPGFEEAIRHEIGCVLEPTMLSTLADSIRSLMSRTAMTERIRDARSGSIFNVGSSIDVAAQYLSSIAKHE